MILRTFLAVVLAGVAGTLANALAAVVFVNPVLWILALAPGRYAIAVLLAVAIPAIYRVVPGAWGALLALVFLTLAPSLLNKLVFGGFAAWPVLLALNFVYALAALVAYRLVLGSRAA
ncbi:MAG: hypothetical protein ACFCUT_07180 [Kiloniellaceae bacterium]